MFLVIGLAVSDVGYGTVSISEYGNCASQTGYVFLKLHGLTATYESLTDCLQVKKVAGQPEATPLSELQRCLAIHGSETVALKVDFDALSRVTFPAIAHLKLSGGREHYVLLLRHHPKAICYLNPPYAPTWLVPEQFKSLWSGVVLVTADKNQELNRTAWFNYGLGVAPWVGLVLAGVLAIFLLRARQWLGLGLVATACVVLGLTINQLQPKAPDEPPVSALAFAEASVNLGALAVGKRETKLTLHNRGTMPVRDFVIRSSCTCAVVTPPTEVPAGGSVTFPLSLKISPGPRKTTLAVEAKDGGALLAAVTLSWQGASRPTLTPSWIETDEPRMGRPYTRIAKFVYPGGAEALVPTLLGCDCDSPLVKVTAGANHPQAARVADGGLVPKVFGEQEVRIEVQPPAQPGLLRARCKLTVQVGPDKHELPLNLSLTFRGKDLLPEQDTILFSAATAKDLVGQRRVVKMRDERPTGDVQLADVPDWLEATLSRQPDGQGEVRLTLKKLPAAGFTSQVVRLVRPDDAAAMVPLTVLVYGEQE